MCQWHQKTSDCSTEETNIAVKPEGNINSEAPVSRLFLFVILHMPHQLKSEGQGFLSERLLPQVRFFCFNQLVVITIIGSFNYQLIVIFQPGKKQRKTKFDTQMSPKRKQCYQRNSGQNGTYDKSGSVTISSREVYIKLDFSYCHILYNSNEELRKHRFISSTPM